MSLWPQFSNTYPVSGRFHNGSLYGRRWVPAAQALFDGDLPLDIADHHGYRWVPDAQAVFGGDLPVSGINDRRCERGSTFATYRRIQS